MALEVSDERWLRKECKKRGVLCVKLSILVGIPDRMLLAPGARVAFVELKTPLGSLSPMQVWWQKKLRDRGFFAECIDTREGLLRILNLLEE